MEDGMQFQQEVDAILATIDQQSLSYDEGEFWMIQGPYEYLSYYARENRLINTAIALPLARGLHDGMHRKYSITKNGMAYRLPYSIHCLIVCRILVDIKMPLSPEEEDLVLAAALCHDMLEDLTFTDQGEELVWKYHLDPKVLEIVKLVTKKPDCTPEDFKEYCDRIQENKLSLLVKLSDRSHNVEDLYNMSASKIREYISETREYFLPMCRYGFTQYPELRTSFRILNDKIKCLTQAAESMMERCEAREQELKSRYDALKTENKALHEKFDNLMKR